MTACALRMGGLRSLRCGCCVAKNVAKNTNVLALDVDQVDTKADRQQLLGSRTGLHVNRSVRIILFG